jgi:hypothetical protein
MRRGLGACRATSRLEASDIAALSLHTERLDRHAQARYLRQPCDRSCHSC